MSSDPGSLLKLGFAVGAGAGLALGAWRLSAGASVASAVLTGLGTIAVGVVLAAVAAIGVRLQRKDLP